MSRKTVNRGVCDCGCVLPLNQPNCPNCGAKIGEMNVLVTPTLSPSELESVYEKNHKIRPLLNAAEYWAYGDSPALASVKYAEAAEALLSSSNYKDAATCFRFASKYAPKPESQLFYETKAVECELRCSPLEVVTPAARENIEALIDQGDVGMAEKQAFLLVMKAVSDTNAATALKELDSIPRITTLTQDKNDPLYRLRSGLVCLGKHRFREAEDSLEEVRRLLTWRYDLREDFAIKALSRLQTATTAN